MTHMEADYQNTAFSDSTILLDYRKMSIFDYIHITFKIIFVDVLYFFYKTVFW